MLGDDAVRDRRLAVGVVAASDDVVTLRVAPQKFLSAMDALTLRLFGRLRQQQEQVLQVRSSWQMRRHLLGAIVLLGSSVSFCSTVNGHANRWNKLGPCWRT